MNELFFLCTLLSVFLNTSDFFFFFLKEELGQDFPFHFIGQLPFISSGPEV